MSEHHKTIPVQVWADIDEGVAEMVRYLNTISGVRTHASCQGTIGEGGPAPYRAQVMATWPPEVFARLSQEFDVTLEGDNWGYLHPRASPDAGSRKPALDPATVEALTDLVDTFEQMRGYPPDGDSDDPCFDLCGAVCCNEFGCMHLKATLARAAIRALAGKEGA